VITTEQRELRRKYLGSSDAAAVLGLDAYRSAADVYLQKTAPVDDDKGNEHTDRGNLLEPVLIQYAVREAKLADVVTGEMVVHPSGLLASNFDARSGDGTAIVEAKTTVMGEEWGDPGTDQVPDRVNVQVAHQFCCLPTARIAWVPVLLPGFKSFDWRIYRIDRNDELCAIVEKSGLKFMREFVRAGVKPTDFRPNLEILKRVRREPGKVISVPDRVVGRWLAAKAVLKLAEKAVEREETRLQERMAAEKAEGARFSGGIVTYLETTRKAYTATVAECRYRTLRLKANRKELQ
jgi:putative phage-type endonuclease